MGRFLVLLCLAAASRPQDVKVDIAAVQKYGSSSNEAASAADNASDVAISSHVTNASDVDGVVVLPEIQDDKRAEMRADTASDVAGNVIFAGKSAEKHRDRERLSNCEGVNFTAVLQVDENETVESSRGNPLESILGGTVTSIETAIVSYAALNDGRCPISIPTPVPGVSEDYTYGIGCGFSSERLCGCPQSPIYVCAKGDWFGAPVGGGLTGSVVAMFGYCRIGWWVIITGIMVLSSPIVALVCCQCCRSREKQNGGVRMQLDPALMAQDGSMGLPPAAAAPPGGWAVSPPGAPVSSAPAAVNPFSPQTTPLAGSGVPAW